MARSMPWTFPEFCQLFLDPVANMLHTCRTSILRGRVPSMSSIASLPSSVLIPKLPCCPFDVLCDLFLRWRLGSPFSNLREYVSILIHLSVRKRVQEVIRVEEARPGDEATETELDLKLEDWASAELKSVAADFYRALILFCKGKALKVVLTNKESEGFSPGECQSTSTSRLAKRA